MFDSVFIECPKCGGLGVLLSYYYVDQGRCFKCGGSGKIHRLTAKPADVLTPYQLEQIKIAKQELDKLGYFNLNDCLLDINPEQLLDIMNQHRYEQEIKHRQAQPKSENWFDELFEL